MSREQLEQALAQGFLKGQGTHRSRFTPLLIDNRNSFTMSRAIINELRHADSFTFSVAFITPSALNVLKQELLEYEGEGVIITSNYLGFNSPATYRELLNFPNLSVRVIEAKHGFHAKGYVFRKGDQTTAIVGSSNLTVSALSSNLEWNFRFSSDNQGHVVSQIEEAIAAQCSLSSPVDNQWIANFEKTYTPKLPASWLDQRAVHMDVDEAPSWDINLEKERRFAEEPSVTPNAMQQSALQSLADLRADGKASALVVSATGTGKTMLAALDVRSYAPQRLLFLAHREQILDKASQEFRLVLEAPAQEFGKLVGTRRDLGSKYLFATTQSFVRAVDQGLIRPDDFDYVVIDEAHHLNNEEQSGATLAYRLLENLERHGRVRGMVFFTGTPHKGKDFNFLSLLQLLRKDLFPDPNLPLEHYLPNLPEVLIRNNKYSVTDLAGVKLFRPPSVTTETYTYAPEETAFYEMMTEFITTGKTYASTLGSSDARTATLVLITLQKLASSSIAAVRSALARRLERLKQATSNFYALGHATELLERDGDGNEDELRALEEVIASYATGVTLMEDEQARIEELLQAASHVRSETKIERIVDLVANRFSGRSVLLFTEYKATQSLLMTRLRMEFGAESTTFINGDERAVDVGGETLQIRREAAADAFNSGTVRLLVSTEAAGEGIDLQRNCHTLVHVDLPWNPMRLHQRVGRINRYGQEEHVEVVSLRNPDTVESRIWQKLNTKIDRIQQALGVAMDEPEDLMQLVLGMTSSSVFTDLFANAPTSARGSLSEWFDERTASFGGHDVVETVRSLIGHSTRFDYQSASPQIPRLDLPHLEPFFRLMLGLNKRRVSTTSNGLSFITPEEWRRDIGVLPRYEGMVFERELQDRDANQRILGVGHKLVEKALEQAKNFEHFNARLPLGTLPGTTVLFRIQNRVTTDEAPVRRTLVGLTREDHQWKYLDAEGVFHLLSEGLKRLDKAPVAHENPPAKEVESTVEEARQWMQKNGQNLGLPFKHPDIQVDSLLWIE